MNIEKRNWMPIKPGCELTLRCRAMATAMAVCVGLLHSVLAQTTPAAATTDANTPAEQFKAFLAKPPVVESMVFQIINHAMHGKEDKGPPTQLYHARWQADAFSLQLIKGTEEIDQVSEGVPLFGKNSDFYWRVFTSTLVKASPRHNSKLYLLGADAVEICVIRPLCLGLMNVNHGELQWEGNKFRTVKGKVKGEAFLSSDNRISKIIYNAGGTADLTIDYQYATNVGVSFLPNRMTTSLPGLDRKPIPFEEIIIASIKLSDEALPPEVFDPKRFGAKYVGVYSNDVYYADTGNRLIDSTDPKLQPVLAKKRSISLASILTVFAVSLVALVGIVKKSVNHKTNTTQL